MSSRHSSPRKVILSLWLVALALSLYAADDIRGWIIGSPKLSEQAWAIRIGNGLSSVSERLYLPALRDGLEGALKPPVERYIVLQKAAPPRGEPETELLPVVATREGSGSEATEDKGQELYIPPTPIRSVLLIGASSIQHQPGIELERLFGSFYDNVRAYRLGKVATGLARPDVFDWPKKAKELVDEHRPELVIANFGGNDAQGMMVGRSVLKFGTEEWDEEYASRLTTLIENSSSRGARVAIIGMPIMRSPRSSERVKRINAITKQAAERAGAIYISSWEISADEKGAYRETIEHNGVRGAMRQQDGWHYTRLGGEYVAARLLEDFERHYYLVPKETTLAATISRTIESKALGKEASYLAYVPHTEGKIEGCYPALFLLHGAGGRFSDWSSQAHRELQQLSEEHGIVIVTPEGGQRGWYIDSPLMKDSQYASHIIKEVLADAKRHLPISDHRAIAGLSAGGHGAITLSLLHPGTFISASSMSGVLDLPAAASRAALIERLGPYRENPARWEERSAWHLIERAPEEARKLPLYITVGSSDHWAETNRRFHDMLTSLRIEHGFEESEGGHDWRYWRGQLPKHVAWHAERLRARFAEDGCRGR